MNWDNVICKKCGSINDYRTVVKSKQHTCWCNGCSAFLGNKPQDNNIDDITMPFGKWVGVRVVDVDDKYLFWVYENIELKGALKAAIHKKLNIEE